jgi:hypothetical protein
MSEAKRTLRKALKRKRDENDTTATQGTKKAAASPSRPEAADEENNASSNIKATAPRSSKMEEVNEAIGHMDNGFLADHFAKQ